MIAQQLGAEMITVGSGPSLHVRVVNDKIMLDGRMPGEAIRASLMTRAEDAFGPDRVVEQIQVNRRLDQPKWLPALPAILTDVLSQIKTPGLLISEYGVTISGEASNQETKDHVLRNVAAVVGSDLPIHDRIIVVKK
jgi:OOP family OmpA-OmpF porin